MRPMPKTVWDYVERFNSEELQEACKIATNLPTNARASFIANDFPRPWLTKHYYAACCYLVQHPAWKDASKDKLRNDAVQMANIKMGELAALAAFDAYGRRSFFISDGLADRLAATELNVPANMLRPPFPACLLVYDCPSVKRSLSQLADEPNIDLVSPVSVLVQQVVLKEKPTLILDVSQVDFRNRKRGFGTIYHFNLSPDATMESELRNHPRMKREGFGNDVTGAGIEDDDFFFAQHRIARVVLNTLLYLSSASRELSRTIAAADRVTAPIQGQSSKAKKRLAEETRKYSSLPYIEVGPSIEYNADDAFISSNQLTTRFMVRGHYRNQAYGEGHALRRLQWIEPFWKGPEMADVVHKPYRVDGGQ